MPEEQQPQPIPSQSEKRNPRPRGHRGGRGRGRGPRVPREGAKEMPPSAPSVESADVPPAQEQPAREPVRERREIREPRAIPAPQPPRNFSASAIAHAVDDVQQIVEALEHALEQMEEVLKLVQTAEQQKIGDEREIESLRRALRKFQPSRNQPRETPPEESTE